MQRTHETETDAPKAFTFLNILDATNIPRLSEHLQVPPDAKFLSLSKTGRWVFPTSYNVVHHSVEFGILRGSKRSLILILNAQRSLPKVALSLHSKFLHKDLLRLIVNPSNDITLANYDYSLCKLSHNRFQSKATCSNVKERVNKSKGILTFNKKHFCMYQKNLQVWVYLARLQRTGCAYMGNTDIFSFDAVISSVREL